VGFIFPESKTLEVAISLIQHPIACTSTGSSVSLCVELFLNFLKKY